MAKRQTVEVPPRCPWCGCTMDSKTLNVEDDVVAWFCAVPECVDSGRVMIKMEGESKCTDPPK